MAPTGDKLGPFDLLGLALALLVVFAVYIYKLIREYADEEEEVEAALNISAEERDYRRQEAYEYAQISSRGVLLLVALCGLAGAFIGGHCVAMFADIALTELGLSDIVTAFLLAAFGGMSEYVLLWSSHVFGVDTCLRRYMRWRNVCSCPAACVLRC